MEICEKCSKKYMPHLIEALTICDECADTLLKEMQEPLYQIAAITESPNEGQKRYDAAIEYLSDAPCLYDSYDDAVYLENNWHVQQALKIAAGIPE